MRSRADRTPDGGPATGDLASVHHDGSIRYATPVGDPTPAGRATGTRSRDRRQPGRRALIGRQELAGPPAALRAVRVLAAIGGLLISGLSNVASVTLADSYLLPSVAAAVIGGTSILGGRGGYTGTIVGALILTVLTSILSSLGYPEAVRQILFGFQL